MARPIENARVNIFIILYYYMLQGTSKTELIQHKRTTIHNKKGGTLQIMHNPLKKVQIKKIKT